jgi:hypothetical protein
MNYIEHLNLIFKLENSLSTELDDYIIDISPSQIIEYYNHIF